MERAGGFADYIERVLRPTAAKLVAQEYREHGDIVKRIVEFEPTGAASRAGLGAAELLIGLAALARDGVIEASFVEPTLSDLRVVGEALARLDVEFLFRGLSEAGYRRLVAALWSLAGPGASEAEPPLCSKGGGEPPVGPVAATVSVLRASSLARLLAERVCTRLRRIREALGVTLADPMLREALAEELRGLASKLSLVAEARCGVVAAAASLPPERLGAIADEASRLASLLRVLREAADATREAARLLGSGAASEALDKAIDLLCGGD